MQACSEERHPDRGPFSGRHRLHLGGPRWTQRWGAWPFLPPHLTGAAAPGQSSHCTGWKAMGPPGTRSQCVSNITPCVLTPHNASSPPLPPPCPLFRCPPSSSCSCPQCPPHPLAKFCISSEQGAGSDVVLQLCAVCGTGFAVSAGWLCPALPIRTLEPPTERAGAGVCL